MIQVSFGTIPGLYFSGFWHDFGSISDGFRVDSGTNFNQNSNTNLGIVLDPSLILDFLLDNIPINFGTFGWISENVYLFVPRRRRRHGR